MKKYRLVLAGLLALVGGCASSGGPPPPRFSVPPGLDRAPEWVGRYAGMGSVYTQDTGDWQHEQSLEIEIGSSRPNWLTIAGNPESSAAWSFVIHGQLGAGRVLTGEGDAPDGAHYVYSFALTDTQLTGVVKRRRFVDAQEAPDEWVFALDRQSDLR